MQCCIPPPMSTEGSHLYTQHILQTSASAIATQEPTGSKVVSRVWYRTEAVSTIRIIQGLVPDSSSHTIHIHTCPSTYKQHISLTGYPGCHYKVRLRLWYARWGIMADTDNKQYLGYQSATFLHGVTRGVAQ